MENNIEDIIPEAALKPLRGLSEITVSSVMELCKKSKELDAILKEMPEEIPQ